MKLLCYQISLNDDICVRVDQVAIWIDVKTKERHSYTVLIEENVGMWAENKNEWIMNNIEY